MLNITVQNKIHIYKLQLTKTVYFFFYSLIHKAQMDIIINHISQNCLLDLYLYIIVTTTYYTIYNSARHGGSIFSLKILLSNCYVLTRQTELKSSPTFFKGKWNKPTTVSVHSKAMFSEAHQRIILNTVLFCFYNHYPPQCYGIMTTH